MHFEQVAEVVMCNGILHNKVQILFSSIFQSGCTLYANELARTHLCVAMERIVSPALASSSRAVPSHFHRSCAPFNSQLLSRRSRAYHPAEVLPEYELIQPSVAPLNVRVIQRVQLHRAQSTAPNAVVTTKRTYDKVKLYDGLKGDDFRCPTRPLAIHVAQAD